MIKKNCQHLSSNFTQWVKSAKGATAIFRNPFFELVPNPNPPFSPANSYKANRP